MRLSEHDVDAVADVAAFCSDDEPRTALQCVWFADGWVAATDSYRIDAREVDSDHAGPVNPFDLRPMDLKPLSWWSVLRSGPVGAEVTSRTLTTDEIGQRPSLRAREVLCLGCLAWERDDIGRRFCGCTAPLVNRRYLWEALSAADEPEVRLRWRTHEPLKPVRYDEDGHFHLLMTIRAAER